MMNMHDAHVTCSVDAVPHPPAPKALSAAELLGSQINLVECHGTGTALGDPIETGALKAVLAQGRSMPVQLATVKTNIGFSDHVNVALLKLQSRLTLSPRSGTPILRTLGGSGGRSRTGEKSARLAA